MPAKNVSISQICRILAGEGHEPLTEMAVSKFVRDGMPKAARGLYDPQACTHWYLGRLRSSVKRKETESKDGEVHSLDRENIRLIRAKADNEEMTAAERRGELIPLQRYEMEMANLVGIVKTQLLNLPSRVAPLLDGLSRTESKALLTASIKTALSKMSKITDGNSDHSRATVVAAKRTRARAARKPKSRKR